MMATRNEAPRLLVLAPRLGGDVVNARLLLAFVTVLAAVLRLVHVESDLWLDEIVAVVDASATPTRELLGRFAFAGRHPLYAATMRGLVLAFGDSAWIVRLPAVVAGIASVPALYWLARAQLRRREALVAALLLATSYHHIFFSQNARGYTGLLLGTTLATAIFLRALASNAGRDWLGYAAILWLTTWTVALGAFVAVGHGTVVAGLAIAHRLRGRATAQLLRAPAAAMAGYALACALSYADALGQISGYIQRTYRAPGEGFAFWSQAHLDVWLAGLAPIVGGRHAWVVAVLLVGGVAVAVLLLRQRTWLLVLGAPLLALVGFVVIADLRPSPRFFLWSLPVAILVAATAAARLSDLLRRRGQGRTAGALPASALAAVALLSLLALLPYYQTPKQPTRESLSWIAAAGASGGERTVVAIRLARWGVRYYAPEMNWVEGRDFAVVQELPELTRLEAEHGASRLWLVTTFRRALRAEAPTLVRHIEERYRVVRSFAATVGHGAIDVWTARDAMPAP